MMMSPSRSVGAPLVLLVVLFRGAADGFAPLQTAKWQRHQAARTNKAETTNDVVTKRSPRSNTSNTAAFVRATITPRTFGTSSRLHASSSSSSNANKYDDECDVLVVGSGPAARAIASLLSAGSGSGSGKKKFDVVLADKNADREWPPNYGVWKDEWQAVCARYRNAGVDIKGGNVGDSVDREWPVTDCYFGGSFDIPTTERMRLDRPYCRVDKNALRESFTAPDTYRILKANHFSKAIGVNVYSPAGSLVHDEAGTTIQLKDAAGKVQTVRTKLVVDCTGHESELVLKDARDEYSPPGFQIAYGLLADVEGEGVRENEIGPYDKEAMTLFDYRADHYDSESPADQDKVRNAPTFMYAMPLKGNTIFFEETSLVARPAVSFQECKDRCYRRLEHLGISVTKVYEEEFCYIPMGGALPARDQRVVGLGGAAAMVHPSTGYHICRVLMGAVDAASALEKELLSGGSGSSANLDRAAAAAYHAIWSPGNVRQRNFAVFGGEFLMKQDVVGLRGFFDGFFRLPLEQWGGFLAGWPGLPNNDQHETWVKRMLFGVNFIIKLPPPVALDMAANIVASCFTGTSLLQSVTPFFGEPDSYEYERNNDRMGDVAAKEEAKRMIQGSSVTAEIPVAFGDADKGGQKQQLILSENNVEEEATASTASIASTGAETETQSFQ